MSILFRRRIKIIPGVRLNISKSGLSASVGVRGASVTLGGKGGTYGICLPGKQNCLANLATTAVAEPTKFDVHMISIYAAPIVKTS